MRQRTLYEGATGGVAGDAGGTGEGVGAVERGEQAKKEAMAFPTFLQAVFDNSREHLEANIPLVHRLLEDPATSREPSEGR